MIRQKYFMLVWAGLILISFTSIACDSKKSDFKSDFELAHKAANEGDFNRAIELYTKSLEYPGLPQKSKARVFYNRGFSYDGKGQYDKAIIDYSNSIELDPANKDTLIRRALTYKKQEQFDKTIADISRVIKLNPDGLIYNAEHYKVLGRMEFYQSRFDRAADNFSQVANNNDLYSILWLFMANERQGKEGKQLLKGQSSATDLNNWPGPVVSMFLGTISPDTLLEKAKNDDKKIENEQNCEAYFYIGEHYLIQGDKNKAKELFQRVIDTGVTSFFEYFAANVELKHS
ncbi:MAG: tetratricopeptide repeat protein [Nitrospinales bacterium]